MALRYWIEGKEREGNVLAVQGGQALLDKYGDVVLNGDNKTPVLVTSDQPVAVNLEVQADKLAYLFAKELGKSRQQYIDQLPLSAQLEGYEGSLVIVQVPQGKLTLVRMLEIQGVTNYLSNPKDVKDWQKDPQKFKTPSRPYVTYLNDGTRNLGRAPRDVRTSLSSDERGGTVFDGLALLAQNPDVLKHHYLDLPGSQVESGLVPYLDVWFGGPELCYDWVDDALPDYGSVVAGRKIVTR